MRIKFEMKKVLIITAFTFGIFLITASYNIAEAQKAVSPVGCFHDLLEVEGDIFGFGVLKIWKRGKGYAGTFSERRTELGEHYDETPLRNIRFDQRTLTLRFDITFNDPKYTRRNAKAVVLRSGIRLDVGKKMRSEYNGPNPLFLRKSKDDCP